MPHTFRVNPNLQQTRNTTAWLPMFAFTLVVTGCATTSVPSESPVPATESPVATQAPVAPPAAVEAEPASPSAISEDIDPELWYQLLVAEFASRRNQPQLAATNMLDAARQTAEPALARRATTLAIVAGNETGALDAAKLWTEVAPADNDAHQVLGTMYLALGDIDNAHGELTYLLNDPSGTTQNNLRQITGVLGRERNRANALELMRRLVDDRPDDVAAQLAYANLALRADNVTLARTILDSLLLGAELDGDIALTYVAVLQREGNPSAAVDWLEKVLAERPDAFDIRLIYARMLTDYRRFEDAIAQYEILRDQDPDDDVVLYTLGLLALQTGRAELAERSFSRLTEIGGESQDQAYYYLGQISENRDDTRRALTMYRKVKGGNYQFDSELRIARLLAADGDLSRARAQLQSIVPRNEREQTLMVMAEAEVLIDAGMLSEAMAVYDAALYEDYDADLLYARALLAEKFDRLDWLERDLRRIIERDPNNAMAINALGYTLADRTKRYDEALALITRALQMQPDEFSILDSMGWVLYRLGRLEEAREYLERALGVNNDPEVVAHLSVVLTELGRQDDARSMLEDALETAPEDVRLRQALDQLQP